MGASDEPECLSHYVHDSVHDCVRCESREKVMETEARGAVTESIRGGRGDSGGITERGGPHLFKGTLESMHT